MESLRIKQNKEALYQAAKRLKDLNDQVVYVGGRIVGLLITDAIEDDVRPTFDIDIALNLGKTDIVTHYSIQKKLESLGFKPDGISKPRKKLSDKDGSKIEENKPDMMWKIRTLKKLSNSLSPRLLMKIQLF